MSYYTVRIINFLFIVLLVGHINAVHAADPIADHNPAQTASTPLNPPSSDTIFTDPATPSVPPSTTTYQYPFADGQVADDLRTKFGVIELFNSLDCPFCANAEQLMADLNRHSTSIVLICDTDTEESNSPLARTFCVARQERYGAKLSDGLIYTPQMIMNGHVDAVGHQFEDVRVGLNTAFTDTIVKLVPRTTNQDNTITVDLPNIKLTGKGRTDIFAITYRPPYTVPNTVRQSLIRPEPLIHVANRFIPLGTWDGAKKTINIPFITDNDNAGFIVMIQDEDNNIVAAGEWPERTQE